MLNARALLCQESRVAEQRVAAAVMHDLTRFEEFIADQHIGEGGYVLRASDSAQWCEVHEALFEGDRIGPKVAHALPRELGRDQGGNDAVDA
jgi:hypothetical protein